MPIIYINNDDIRLNSSSSDKVVVNGNLGIGTTSPSEKLHVVGNGLFTGGVYVNNTSAYLWNATNGVIRFGTNNTERARIDATGNVGIGTTAPNSKLHISTTSSNPFRMVRTGGTSTNFGYEFGSGDIGLYDYTNSAYRYYITSGGNVLIGTTTDAGYKLEVNGSARVNSSSNLVMFVKSSSTSGAAISFEDPNTGGNDAISAGAIGSSFYITTGFNERVKIDSSGFVGIAATPSSSWTLAIDSLFGADGALKTTGSVNINSGALGVNVAPSATAGRIDASNDIVAFSTSDSRLKENVTPIANALDKVKALTGVEFDWKAETKDVHGYEGHDVGVIAQEVQAVLPEAVRTNDSGYLSVRYEKMIALLIESNKDLAARVEELEKKLK